MCFKLDRTHFFQGVAVFKRVLKLTVGVSEACIMAKVKELSRAICIS